MGKSESETEPKTRPPEKHKTILRGKVYTAVKLIAEYVETPEEKTAFKPSHRNSIVFSTRILK
jgi:superfamily I DNA and/or RNA helicase